MLIALPNPDRFYSVAALHKARNEARNNFFDHVDPGGLTPADLNAWAMEHEALHLLLKAAQIRLDAEEEMVRLLAAEQTVAA